ncbi:MAG: DUF433 domain-containing protein [Pirellulales bacterium]
MPLTIQADMPPLIETDDGVVRISGTRIPLERVVRAFLAGSTPEQIAHDYDVLTVEQVYAVVNYYLHHRSEVDAYLNESERKAAETRAEIERQFDPAGIRARLLARRAHPGGES